MKALIFDLDDTLIPETESIASAFAVAGEIAHSSLGLDPNALRQAVLKHARELWHAAPSYPYAQRLGLASWEALTSAFPGPTADSDLAYLRSWARDYRLEVWSEALRDLGLESPDAAEALAEAYRGARFELHPPAPDAHDTLRCLKDAGRTLALLTNGPADLQRQKLAKSGLEVYFPPDQIVISTEVGYGKPEPCIFEIVIERLGVEAGDAIMIGDNPRRDIEGSLAAGIIAIWLRNHREDTLVAASVPRVDTLAELPGAIAAIEAKDA